MEAFKLYTEGDNSVESTFNKIEALKAEMKTKRTNWTQESTHTINITAYRFLGFVEGDGSWNVDKKNYLLSSSIVQSSKDLELMEAIKNYLNNLNRHFSDVVSLVRHKNNKRVNQSDMINLIVTKTEFIYQILVPFFQKMIWLSKKEMDFADWVSILELKKIRVTSYRRRSSND